MPLPTHAAAVGFIIWRIFRNTFLPSILKTHFQEKSVVPAGSSPVILVMLVTLYIKNTFSGEVCGSCWLPSILKTHFQEKSVVPAGSSPVILVMLV